MASLVVGRHLTPSTTSSPHRSASNVAGVGNFNNLCCKLPQHGLAPLALPHGGPRSSLQSRSTAAQQSMSNSGASAGDEKAPFNMRSLMHVSLTAFESYRSPNPEGKLIHRDDSQNKSTAMWWKSPPSVGGVTGAYTQYLSTTLVRRPFSHFIFIGWVDLKVDGRSPGPGYKKELLVTLTCDGSRYDWDYTQFGKISRADREPPRDIERAMTDAGEIFMGGKMGLWVRRAKRGETFAPTITVTVSEVKKGWPWQDARIVDNLASSTLPLTALKDSPDADLQVIEFDQKSTLLSNKKAGRGPKYTVQIQMSAQRILTVEEEEASPGGKSDTSEANQLLKNLHDTAMAFVPGALGYAEDPSSKDPMKEAGGLIPNAEEFCDKIAEDDAMAVDVLKNAGASTAVIDSSTTTNPKTVAECFKLDLQDKVAVSDTIGTLLNKSEDYMKGAKLAESLKESTDYSYRTTGPFEEFVAFIEVPQTSTEVLVLWNEAAKEVAVSFRGTEQQKKKDIATDANIIPKVFNPSDPNSDEGGGPLFSALKLVPLVDFILPKKGYYVHGGFKVAWRSVQTAVERVLNEIIDGDDGWKVVFMGHSLGGALATIGSAYELGLRGKKGGLPAGTDIACYTFGSPLVGSKDFCDFFDDGIKESWRMFHTGDVVSKVPRLAGNVHVTGGTMLELQESVKLSYMEKDQALPLERKPVHQISKEVLIPDSIVNKMVKKYDGPTGGWSTTIDSGKAALQIREGVEFHACSNYVLTCKRLMKLCAQGTNDAALQKAVVCIEAALTLFIEDAKYDERATKQRAAAA